MINNLQLDVKKEDYSSLSYKLNISNEQATNIKFIEAEQLLRQDKDEKFHNTPKFQINLLVRDASIITEIQDGLLYYFNTNPYVLKYKNEYSKSNIEIINSIEKEIAELKTLRVDSKSNIDMSTFRVFSNKDNTEIQNPIIDLVHKKQEVKTQDLLNPLDYVKSFTRTEVAEREVLIWGSTVGVLSFFLSLLIALVREVKSKALKK